jgi:hypothetical protein
MFVAGTLCQISQHFFVMFRFQIASPLIIVGRKYDQNYRIVLAGKLRIVFDQNYDRRTSNISMRAASSISSLALPLVFEAWIL